MIQTKPHSTQVSKLLCWFALSALTVQASVLPVDLPAPDPDDKGRSDQPVKVYILSGQSNMLGFARVEGAEPSYTHVFLSGDPSVDQTKQFAIIKQKVAMAPVGIYQSGDKDAARGGRVKGVADRTVELGVTTAEIPHAANGKEVTVEAYIEVPFTGTYRIHADGDALVRVDGKLQDKASGVMLSKNKRHRLEISYPQGGVSAALWLEKTDLEGKGDLRWVVEKLGRFPYMMDEQGEWTVRQDVMLNNAYMGKGRSAPLGVSAVGQRFGPELGFGYVMGAFHDEPVIVIKADIGNRSLGWDILPPGTESWTHEGKTYPGYGLRLDENGKPVKPEKGQWYAGKQYDDFTASIRKVLDNFDEKYPQYADQGFEVAGFVWWQGHKDGPNPGHNVTYERNLANLIKAWREEFKEPNAKWAIATVGFYGDAMEQYYVEIAEAQMAMADPQRHPEFAGTVKTIDTRPFWREASVSPIDQYYHYNHNAETYMLTGDALGRAMVELLGGEVEYPSAEPDESVSALPQFSWAKQHEVAAMAPALRPIVLDKLVPEFVAEAPKIPAFRRGGLPIENILIPKMPEKPNAKLRGQYDRLQHLYQMGGIDSYSWQATGPEMQLADWHYLSFDPPEKKTSPKGDRYREVTLPKGSENWMEPDFDPTRAGWKIGPSPFGQKNGKLEALRSDCRVSYCGCHITPNTLWEKEVLLLRQSFKFPEFEQGKRYRLVVGGAGHPWSGEGYALYLNGKKVSELTQGGYKNGGFPRGTFLFEELAEACSGQEVTLALKAFLRQNQHRDKAAPPSGHISVWLESTTLPAVLDSIPLDIE